MKFFILLTLFVGIIMVMHGVYKEDIDKEKKNVKVEYRFVPRSYYDEQLFSNNFESKFSNLFDDKPTQWSANQRLIPEPENGEDEYNFNENDNNNFFNDDINLDNNNDKD